MSSYLAPNSNRPDASVLSSVAGTQMSSRTGDTSYSVPEDGRPITIPTTGKVRGDKIHQTSKTSLMIEYYEGVDRQPSVRVKVAGKDKEGREKTNTLQVIDSKKSKRGQPIFTHRISLSPQVAEKQRRLEAAAAGKRIASNDGSISSFDSNVQPLNVRDREWSPLNSPREIELGSDVARRRTRSKGGSGSGSDPLFGSPSGRSRSVSRETYLTEEGQKTPRALGRRRSRSLSRERISSRHEQAARDKLGDGTKERRGVNRGYEPKAIRGGRSRSASATRAVDKGAAAAAAAANQDDGQKKGDYDPALLNLIEDAIRRVVQPQLQELKKQQNGSSFDKTMKDLSSQVSSALMPPKQAGKSEGHGLIVAGGAGGGGGAQQQQHYQDNDSAVSRGLGAGLALDDDRGVSPAGTRASIMTAQSGLPYPTAGRGDHKIPGSGNTPPPPLSFGSKSNTPVPATVGGRRVVREPVGGEGASLRDNRTVSGGTSMEYSNGSTKSVHATPATTMEDHKLGDGLSIADLSDPQSTNVARARRNRNRDISAEYEAGSEFDSEIGNHQSNSAVDWYFAEEQEKAQENGLYKNKSNNTIEARLAHTQGSSSPAVDVNHLDKGQPVTGLGANPAFCPTPIAAISAQASLVDGISNRSSAIPALTASAIPKLNSPMPDLNHIQDDDEITNPSEIQGPGPGNLEIKDWHYGGFNNPSSALKDPKGFGAAGGEQATPQLMPKPAKPTAVQDRAFSPGGGGGGKDEGYISAANVLSPEMNSPAMTPIPGMTGMENFTDMMTSNVDYPYRGHQRNASGNSHGMPSPLYDSAMGRGIDKIQDKDIVALMDHLTVRDAQRNARDTEILVSLVRSAAEMRNYFEDIKKQLDEQTREIVTQVDANTERTVSKFVGPRPMPASAPRAPRARAIEDEDESTKRKNVFKRALKGLSMRSSNDLARIEDMLETLLNDVDGLKQTQGFYQQSMMGTLDSIKKNDGDAQASAQVAPAVQQTTPPRAAVPTYSNTTYNPSYSDPRPTYHTISPIQEAITPSPHNSAGPQEEQLQEPTLPRSMPETPEKKSKRDSTGTAPKFSRWSETTASTGLGRFFGRKNRDSTETGVTGGGHSRTQSDLEYDQQYAQEHVPDVPPLPRQPSPLLPSSRGTDAPLTQANRMSLEIKHPQPRPAYRHQEIEQKAQTFAPIYNASTSSLGINNTPLKHAAVPEGYSNLNPDNQMSPSGYTAGTGVETDLPKPQAPYAANAGEESDTLRASDNTEPDKKKKKKKDRNDPERIARREKRRAEREKAEREGTARPRRKKENRESTDLESAMGGAAASGLTSTPSKIGGPRPLSRGAGFGEEEGNRESLKKKNREAANAWWN